MNNVTFLSAAAAAAFLTATPASAWVYTAPQKAGTGRVIMLEPLAFIKIDDLDFGGYIIPTSGSGNVSVDSATTSVTVDSALTQLPQFTPQRGRFEGAGTENQAVEVVAVLPTALYLNGDTSSSTSVAVALTLDQPVNVVTGNYDYTIGSGKVFDVYVGGDLTISAGMTPGVYSNQFTLTATYQ